jgi:hypothetical protein
VGGTLGSLADPRAFAASALVLGGLWAAIGIAAALRARHGLLRNRRRTGALARGAATGAWASVVAAALLLIVVGLYLDALNGFASAPGGRGSGGDAGGALLVVGALVHAPLGALVGAAVAWRAGRAR